MIKYILAVNKGTSHLFITELESVLLAEEVMKLLHLKFTKREGFDVRVFVETTDTMAYASVNEYFRKHRKVLPGRSE